MRRAFSNGNKFAKRLRNVVEGAAFREGVQGGVPQCHFGALVSVSAPTRSRAAGMPCMHTRPCTHATCEWSVRLTRTYVHVKHAGLTCCISGALAQLVTSLLVC